MRKDIEKNDEAPRKERYDWRVAEAEGEYSRQNLNILYIISIPCVISFTVVKLAESLITTEFMVSTTVAKVEIKGKSKVGTRESASAH